MSVCDSQSGGLRASRPLSAAQSRVACCGTRRPAPVPTGPVRTDTLGGRLHLRSLPIARTISCPLDQGPSLCCRNRRLRFGGSIQWTMAPRVPLFLGATLSCNLIASTLPRLAVPLGSLVHCSAF